MQPLDSSTETDQSDAQSDDGATTRPDWVVLTLVAIAMMLFVVLIIRFAFIGQAESVRTEMDAATKASVQAVEDRYGIRVDAYSFGSPGAWTIDGKDYVCTLTPERTPMAEADLACAPVSDLVPADQLDSDLR